MNLRRLVACGLIAVACGGCSTTPPIAPITSPTIEPQLQAAMNTRVAELLARPLGDEDAVEIALLRNPTLTRVFDQLGLADQRLKLAHLPDPRHEGGRPLGGEEPRIEHASTAALMSWLAGASLADADTAVRQSAAADRAGEVVFEVRRAWVDAVAANQRRHVEDDAVLAAEAARDLAERQWRNGNRPLLQALQAQQAEASAAEKRSVVRAAALVAQERLHAAMGLFFDDADAVQLPPRLPPLPAAPVPADALELRAVSQRLDVQVARVAGLLPGVPVQAAVAGADGHVHQIEYPEEAGLRARREVRSAWIAYAAAHEQARLHVELLTPLAARISDEQLKLSNGMLIGLPVLLADAAARTAEAAATVEAERRFWRADVELQQAMAGVGRIDATAD